VEPFLNYLFNIIAGPQWKWSCCVRNTPCSYLHVWQVPLAEGYNVMDGKTRHCTFCRWSAKMHLGKRS